MGRVIKKDDEQADVTAVSFETEDLSEQADRIPSEEVSVSEEDDEGQEASAGGQVLGSEETRMADDAVVIDADVAPAEPVSAEDAEASSEPAEDESREGEGSEGTSDSEATVTRTDEEWQEHLEEAVEAARSEAFDEGYEAGYDAGYEDAEEELRDEHEEKRDALLDDVTRFEEVWEEYIDESEPMLVELTLRLAETIVDAPLMDSIRQASEEAVTDAVAQLSNVPPITVTVHPIDYQRLHESGLVDRLKKKYEDLHLESDPECAEGDWSVSSPEGVIRRVRSEVVDTLRKELNLAPATPSRPQDDD